MNRMFLSSPCRALIVLAILIGTAINSQAVTFNIAPGSTSNTYNGLITLQIDGLATNEAVIIRKYLDLNGNGIVDSSDYFVQQCQIQDGQGPTLFGGATNINIPYDHGSADGAITTTIPMATLGLIHTFAAQYLYVLSSPSNNFAAVTNSFVVTNPPTDQTLTGTVYNNSTPVPYAAVLVGYFQNGNFNPATGAVTDSSGRYSVNLATGTYMAIALQNNSVGAPAGPFNVTSGSTVTNDLTLMAANATISGQVVDSANPSLPLPGLLISAEGNGLTTSVTDPNGNFTVPVMTGGQWKVSGDDAGWAFLGYVSSNNNAKINITGNVTGLRLSYPKGNAMFYGRVLDSNNQPLAGVRLFGQSANGDGPYQGNATTGANGRYAMAIVDGNWDIGVDTGSLAPQLAGYIFSQSPFAYNNGGAGTNVAPNSAVHQDFVAILATNSISGYLRDSSSNGIPNVQVLANTTINGTTFSAQGATDSSGFYSIGVGNGSWNVFVNCCTGCDSGLPNGYQCPNGQTVNVTNNNQTANFTSAVYTTFLSGRVSDESGIAVSNIYVFAFPANGGAGGGFGAMTDNGGMYTIGLVGGTYIVQMDTGASSGAASRGLVSPFLPLTISDNASISNFNLVARHITGTLVATVTNNNGQPVSGVYVTANATFNGTNYSTGVQMTTSGSTAMPVCDGSWSVGVDCGSLSAQNLQCVSNQNVSVSGNSVAVNFLVHGSATLPAPRLSVPFIYGSGQFLFHLNGAPGQNYTVQYATALSNWVTFLVTNPSSSDVTVTDYNATNRSRTYRVIVGP